MIVTDCGWDRNRNRNRDRDRDRDRDEVAGYSTKYSAVVPVTNLRQPHSRGVGARAVAVTGARGQSVAMHADIVKRSPSRLPEVKPRTGWPSSMLNRFASHHVIGTIRVQSCNCRISLPLSPWHGISILLGIITTTVLYIQRSRYSTDVENDTWPYRTCCSSDEEMRVWRDDWGTVRNRAMHTS